MAKAEIHPGACGLKSVVIATMEDRKVNIQIESECASIRRLAEQLPQVDPYREATFRRGGPQTLELAPKYCSHPACPVPVGIIKAVEIAARLNLPSDVSIKLSDEDS